MRRSAVAAMCSDCYWLRHGRPAYVPTRCRSSSFHWKPFLISVSTADRAPYLGGMTTGWGRSAHSQGPATTMLHLVREGGRAEVLRNALAFTDGTLLQKNGH